MDSTIGVEFLMHQIKIDSQTIKLQIWDTAGQEKYQALGKAYYRNSVGVFLVFSLNSHESFENIDKWLKTAQQYCHPKAKIILIGNKSDLLGERKVTTAEANEYADSNGLIAYIETSAYSGSNVKEAFYQIARQVYNGVVSGEIQLCNILAQNLEDEDDDFKEKTINKKEKTCC